MDHLPPPQHLPYPADPAERDRLLDLFFARMMHKVDRRLAERRRERAAEIRTCESRDDRDDAPDRD